MSIMDIRTQQISGKKVPVCTGLYYKNLLLK